MEDTSDVTRRLWSLCSILRDEGVTYHEYLNELTLLLFLKLASELQVEAVIPSNDRWDELVRQPEDSALEYYLNVISDLKANPDAVVSAIFADADTKIRSGRSLRQLVAGIDEIDWYRARQNGLGDVYEGMIQKNAAESRYGTGQYFTPRAVVDALVQALNPTEKDSVYDPAAGTGGFLVAAGLHASEVNGKQATLVGHELVRDVQRMSLMNLLLHGLKGDIELGDSLGMDPANLSASVCLTNPPFGVKGALTAEQSLHMDFPTSNKQLAFLQHIYKSLAPNGRAAVVIPDNVLFESGVAGSVRSHLLDNFRLHTILRLPTGIFYATGIKTSALFFCADGATEETWIYDLRSGQGAYGKRRPLVAEDLQDFLSAYGNDPWGRSNRKESNRFRRFSRREVSQHEDRLDLAAHEINASDGPTDPLHILDVTGVLSRELMAAHNAINEVERLIKSYLGDADEDRRGDFVSSGDK
ncbi:class I SAM-dependent DNA methyltransferase [Streptomyces sp. NPDC057115]|uniref:HsdM family class I SAM-dependent methyltransferase n=1 Tax=Streptomyces TaxID=1883 RepID=UPI0036358D12